MPGIVDAHVFQVPDAPALNVDVDRTHGRPGGHDQQRDVANNLLVSLNTSAQVAPNFWVNPRNSVSYPLVVQTPHIGSIRCQDLWTCRCRRRRTDRPGGSC